MKSETYYNPKRRLVTLKVSGAIEYDGCLQALVKASKQLKKHDSKRLLIDLRNSSGDLGIANHYKLCHHLDEAGIERKHRICVLHTPESEESKRFFETTCYNYGFTVRSTLFEKDALDWLAREEVKSS